MNKSGSAPNNQSEGVNIENDAQILLEFLSLKRDSLSPLLIVTHDYPDPDALASAMALSYLAQQYFGITSRIVYGGVIGRSENKELVKSLNTRLYKIRPEHLRKYRNIALVDTQPRFDNNPFPAKRKATIIIDQHLSVTKPSAELAIIDTDCGATCASTRSW